jgi:hypothetical protein
VKSRFLLDVVVSQSATIFELFARKDESLLIRRNAFLVLNLGFHLFNCVACQQRSTVKKPEKESYKVMVLPVRVLTKICILSCLCVIGFAVEKLKQKKKTYNLKFSVVVVE